MKILYIGDVMADPGIKVLKAVLPGIRKEHRPDMVIAQSENVSDGKGMTVADMKQLQPLGVDFFTGGNHTPAKDELLPLLSDPNVPVIGPANMAACPGLGWKYFDSRSGRVLVVSLLGQTVGREVEIANPLHFIDKILEDNKDAEHVATIVNFHGDFSSEKRVIGYYLDGRVSAVIGDHWHVPTSDAMVLPKGTAHMTDVGMCGSLHSSLGVKIDTIVSRWRDGHVNKNELEESGPLQFNAALIETNEKGLATSITPIQKIINQP